MRTYRNHEGYIDRTAGEAIRRAGKKSKKQEVYNGLYRVPLTYQIGNLPAFIEAIKGARNDKIKFKDKTK